MLASRAHLVVQITWLLTLLAPIVTFVSIRRARARRYTTHRALQIGLLVSCWATVLAFETILRLRGGSGVFVQDAAPAFRSAARSLLLIHIAGAVATYLLWTGLAVLSLRRFRAVLPGPFSRIHRRLGWIVFFGLCFTALSATAMYVLVFWL